jgi:hypothetical protein
MTKLMTKAVKKAERLLDIQRLLFSHPKGLTIAEIAQELGVNRSSIIRYVDELSVLLPIWEDEEGVVGLQTEGFQKSLPQPDIRDISEELSSLISEGESDLLEFKVTACWDEYNKTKNSKLAENIVKAVVGFMNSQTGGSVLIGVADSGEVVGLLNDFAVADTTKQNRNGYQLFLSNKLNAGLGGECISFYKISFHQIKSNEVCRIQVQSSSKPFYYEGKFYVRNGNQTLLLTTQEAVAYIEHRWS